MESTSPSDSDAGGGGSVVGSTSPPPPPPPTGLLRALLDAGRPQPVNPGSNAGQPSPPAPPPVLSLDQIRATRNSNEYTDGPAVAPRSPAPQPGRQRKSSLVIISPPGGEETQDERPNNLRNQRNLLPSGIAAHPAAPPREGVSRSSSADDSRSSARTSTGSASSGQRLLGSPVAGERIIIRTQPKHAELKPDELKPLTEADPAAAVESVPGSATASDGLTAADKHACQCEDCGRCRCADCVRPRTLPSCWLCGRRCVCSAQNVAEYGTCACCVKGLFYHCSSDDEDTCADKPFSCAQSHCCVRWTAVSLLSFCLPCLLCYLPAKGCLAACQSCYDRATRPGCQCERGDAAHCKSVDKPT